MKAYINGTEIVFEQGETILAAARRNNIFIPSLCAFTPLDHRPGTCRVCLVEAAAASGEPLVVTACDTPLEEGMRVSTSTPGVRSMQRLQVELIFADHAQECASCPRHGDCELQDLAEYVGLTTNRFEGMRGAPCPPDTSSPALSLDTDKCVRCQRCVEVCRSIQGIGALTMDGVGCGASVGVGGAPDWASSSSCVSCGQCTLVCPTGTLAEHDQVEIVLDYLDNPDIVTVFQFAPAVRVVLGEEFSFPRGADVTGQIIAALRHLGADVILDTDFAADVVIMEEGTELLHKLNQNSPLPMFTSCCPGWINFAEKHYPEILPYISSTRSPQQVFGPLAKTYLPEKMGLSPHSLRVISIMPCTAKKYEAARPEFSVAGVPDVDVVLTIREFARLLRRQGVDFSRLEPSAFDNPFMSESTGAAAIFGTTGGVMEAAVRTVYAVLNKSELDFIKTTPLRGNAGIREAVVDLGPGRAPLRVAICHGLKNARVIVGQVLRGESPYHFIEVMACPGGCIDGGGTYRVKKSYLSRRDTRQSALYSIDTALPVRQSHNNAQVQRLYSDFLEKPNSPRAHDLLHTSYTPRRVAEHHDVRDVWNRLTLTK